MVRKRALVSISIPPTRESVWFILRTKGYEVVLDRDLEGILEHRTGDFDLIVLDRRIGGIGTEGVVGLIAEEDPDVRFVVLGEEELENFGSLVAQGVVTLLPRGEHLKEALRDFLNGTAIPS